MALYHFSTKALSRGSRNTVGAIAYRAGCKLYDERTGQSFDYRHKNVEHVELLLPKDAPQWAVEIQKLMNEDRGKGVQAWCDIVEASEQRIDARVWKEFEFALHRELTKEQNMILAREFVQDQICSHGIAAQLNFHFDVDKETGEEKPHCHVTMATRYLEENGLSAKKERSWDTKEFLLDLRAQWQEYSNFHLKLNGHDVRIDHRSYHARGIEIEPQPKMGKGIKEQERRLQTLEGDENGESITDKAKAFRDTQLRNLYRIMRRPDVVLEIVSKHHTTFMWADVQKVLHRYVDELPLFQKLEAKLKASNELMVLRSENLETGEKAIYTTRSLLKAEKSLIATADGLSQSKTHGAQKRHIKVAITKANKELKEFGGLSSDQVKAITHMVDDGQIKCVVGIAGAGKTTALGVCHDIWQVEGYAVYGLAPTGKAAQNLEQGGIFSTTLHKFLKSYEEGRCQYNSNSILVLDEAGMVDMERFEQLLGAVKQLGVKLIVVGDGAQLQPVEAGPAFRLVTTRLGKVELNTVLRQKEAWQREATVLFGKQETQAALQKYMDKGHVHIIEEGLPKLQESIRQHDHEGIVKLYEISTRTSALIYREMMKDIKKAHPQVENTFPLVKHHQDYARYRQWKDEQKKAATQLLKESNLYRPLLEERNIDSLKMVKLFVSKKQDPDSQRQDALALLKEYGLESLAGAEKQPGQGVDVRQDAKAALVHAWHDEFQKEQTQAAESQLAHAQPSLILSFSNRDTNDLNQSARAFLKESGHISKEEFTYTISKKMEDDFDVEYIITEEKNFSKGDRIVFTQNDAGLGVKNGSMGTIIELSRQKVCVRLEGENDKEISFAPKLNPYFDQGWAITIHKSQGTTVDNTYLLASYEMTQNLAYVAMTRHRNNVHVFGSALDFWRPEKLPEVLSKSGEKLSAADYLDAESLNQLMKEDNKLITKIFERLSNELNAMGTVSKKAFWQVADHFLDTKSSQEIRINPAFSQESIREEVRAEDLLQANLKGAQKENRTVDLATTQPRANIFTHEKEKNGAQENATEKNKTENKTEEKGVLEQRHNAMKSEDSTGLNRNKQLDKIETPHQRGQDEPRGSLPTPQHSLDAKTVEDALRQNVASFADDVFSSMGEPYNPGASSAHERRYGKKGHIAVNLKTGAWIDYKDDSLSGGPLHMLTKLKGLSFKEALEYGANWAGLSQSVLSPKRLSLLGTGQSVAAPSQPALQEEVDTDTQAKIDKAKSLWNKGQAIQGTLAERYLREHRKIEGSLPDDLRYLPSFKDHSSNRWFPCLMAGARSQTGDITAVQITFLNPQTAAKADIEVAKRSFGVVKGSAVTIQDPLSEISFNETKNSNTLFIAEGVETALSLKSAGVQGTIEASLGLSNIKRITPESPHTHIVICADHDAPGSPSAKSLEKSVTALQEKGYAVTIIKPDQLGDDFNDVLKIQGPQGIKRTLEKQLSSKIVGAHQSLQKPVLPTPEPSAPRESYENLATQCEERLFKMLKKANKPLNAERLTRIPLQAGRTANFLYHARTLKGRSPSEEDLKHFSLRAKYELDRIPDIRTNLINEWNKKGKVRSYNGMRAQLIAERLASIEGRIFLDAKQKGLEPSGSLANLARQEFKAHKTQTPQLAKELSQKYGLSDKAAISCAQNIFRYKETHGERPSENQIKHMAQISKDLEKKVYSATHDSHESAFLRRREADMLFRNEVAPDARVLKQKLRDFFVQEGQSRVVKAQRVIQEKSDQYEMSM
jgi:Ti-type conjugative transfer relaxase TraA